MNRSTDRSRGSWRRTLAITLAASFAVSSAAGVVNEGGACSAAETLCDKTLVAWVSLANTEQRGGSVVTVIDPLERFDALVFGEVAPGKWMAGSDFFRRTPQDQQAYPAETAGPQTLVQMALVYRGREVALYRDGQIYERHTVDRPQKFGPDALVLLGLRYVGGMGPIGYFAGAIEEARLYDRALDERTLAALAPNQPSDPAPLGQWTFEDGTADDARRHFPRGELCGGARIADGKLHLNGTDAYVICERPAAQPPLMFYRPLQRKTGIMWDTWLYWHDGRFYLYYLAKSGPQWDNISMAVSDDGVHWQERGLILRKADGVTWMGTGSTWRSPRFAVDGRFLMNFSEWRGPRQTIFFAESRDLLHWTRLGPECEFTQDTRWYQEQGRWDCIWTIPRDGGGLFGYWTADPQGRPGVGFGQSLDGVTWEALEPPLFADGAPHGEAGAVEKIGERYYLMLGTGGKMATLVADRPQGPFRPAPKNFWLLAGHTYFSRFFPTPGGLLANHHAIARDGMVYMSPLKAVTVDREGTLRWVWWPGNDKLKSEAVAVRWPPASAATPAGGRVVLLANAFAVGDGVIVEGTLRLPAASGDRRAGVYIETGPGSGVAVLADHRGVTEIGPVAADGSGFRAEQRVDREWTFGPDVRFRLLLKHSLLEFYLDDLLLHCYSLPNAATGRIGLLPATDDGDVRDLAAWRTIPAESARE